MKKTICKTVNFGCLLIAFMLFSIKPSMAQEITAIDFNGDLIGKVIPDGKVINFDNQLIGNINADSLIIGFKGEIIGGIIPQGISIGNDNKFLGKVNNDGTVRLPSGKIVGKVLPNGLVVDDVYDVIGTVLFPGLIYSDSGETVGRLTGDGNYMNLQGQRIGFVSADGYAYRKTGDEHILDGKLISSKMIVSDKGAFIGSLAPGGDVTDFDANVIGHIRANGFVFSPDNKIIGRTVSNGYATANDGAYLGFITYNGEVINEEKTVGRLLASNEIVDLKGDVIGNKIDFSATFSDERGRYVGRLLPNGKIARAKEVVGNLGPNGTVISEDKIIGYQVHEGPVFDYKGSLVAHALNNASVISISGSPLGSMRGDAAFDRSGKFIGKTASSRLALDFNGKILGMTNIDMTVGGRDDKSKVSPFGFVFSSEGHIDGYALTPSPVYGLFGTKIADISLNGDVTNNGNIFPGKMTSAGLHIDERNRILGASLAPDVVTVKKEEANPSAINLVYNIGRIIGKIAPNYNIISANSENTTNIAPKIGQAYKGMTVVGLNGNVIGFLSPEGKARNFSGSIIGKITDNNVVDNRGSYLGELVSYDAVVDSSCSFMGVITPRGEVRNYRETYIGRPLLNGQIVSETGSVLGYAIKMLPVIDDNGNILGTTAANGKVINYNNEDLGCVNAQGILYSSDGTRIGRRITNSSVMDFEGRIIGHTDVSGSVLADDGQIIGYMQTDENVNSGTGIPLGGLFKYKYAYDNSNKFIGRVTEEAKVLNSEDEEIGFVDFFGNVRQGRNNIGYALYDLYVYDLNGAVVGYVAPDGNVLSFINQNIGKMDKGFVLDKSGKIIARGNRDYNVRTEKFVVIGALNGNGEVINNKGEAIGILNNRDGNIFDKKEMYIAKAYPLQYYNNIVTSTPVYSETGEVIGYAREDGSVVDQDGKLIGILNEDGIAISANGAIIGGVGTDWFTKPANKKLQRPDGEIPEVGVSGDINEQARRSMAIALTPDGEYLGRIGSDGRVINDSGKVLGRKMPDGLIIDDDGSLIGVEETAKPDTNGIYIPTGTFGGGGAYGTGTGAGGNLGPGGGYGPGERYDPQRSAALAEAQNQRRQGMSVGKISTSIKTSNFDGMQKNWDEQGIQKAISSWRVDLSEMILADKPIPAVIARSIDSNNPTPVTAYVERNVYSEVGRNIIIPAGSRVMGTLGGLTATSETTSQSAKVSITWERLIRPDGSIFVFQGITGDAQGRGGALGYLDQQLFKKYTLPVMTTMLTSGITYMMATDTDTTGQVESSRQQAASDARQNFENSMNAIFQQILQDKTNIRPLTYVPAGTRIIIYPNVDLWLRTPERDELEAHSQMNKKDVLIDDNEKVREGKEVELKKKINATGGGGSGTGGTGSVVYAPDSEGVSEATGDTLLISDKKIVEDRRKLEASKNTGGKNATAGASTSVGVPPPPPPSTSSSSSSSATESSTNSNIPQLF